MLKKQDLYVVHITFGAITRPHVDKLIISWPWFTQNQEISPVLDIENKPQNISTEEFQQNILTWLHIVEDKYHVKPIIYTYYKFKDLYLSDSRFDDYPYWIAHYYVDKMEYKGDWKFWQHTDAGRLPGINGYVDLDIYNGSFYDLQQLLIQEVMPSQE